MPTPDASAFTRQQKYNAVGERGTTSNNGTKPVTHLTSYVPKVTGLSNFLPSFSNKVVSPLKVSFINTTQKPKKFQAIVPVSSSLFIVIGGVGTNTLLYSTDGNTFTGLGNTSFSGNVLAIVYSSTLKVWLAGGGGTNTLAYSPDGKTWTGLGNILATISGRGFAYSPTLNRWVAGGTGTNTLAYATDPTTVGGANGWTASSSGTSVFTNLCLSIAWSPTLNLFVGGGILSVVSQAVIAFSSDGIAWTPEDDTGSNGNGNSIFAGIGAQCSAIAAHPTSNLFLAGGGGSGNTHTLAFSTDGKTWTGLGKTIISFSVNTFAYSPTLNIWVAGGTGTNTLAYATDPTTVGGANGWTASSSGTSVFTNCLSIVWSPTFKGGAFIAGGTGTNTLAYSTNGTTWIPISISGITQVRAIGTTS